MSLDTLDPEKFAHITRWGKLEKVLNGLAAAKDAGLKIKINAVAVKDFNQTEIPELLKWAHGEGFEMTLIETMPLGEIDGNRAEQYLPLSTVRKELERSFTLQDLSARTGGPARYVTVEETGGRLGFITPLTHNFCESCNRVRLTSTGQLFMCLGQDDCSDLRAAVRSETPEVTLFDAIDEAIGRKPKGHDFIIERDNKNAVRRHMSVTGG